MPERTSYANGVPSWVDLTTPDVQASTAFYGGLLGWEQALAPGDPAMTGGYGMFSLGDKVVAGVGPLRNETQPAVWNSYVAVDDADATVAAATEAGGAVVMPVIDVGDAGRLAYLADPAAAVFGIWQAGQRAGVELVNEPGAYCWNELAVRDAAAATPFYASIFGWDAEPMEGSPMGYITFVRGGAMIAGCMPMDDGWPAEVPSHWMVYFAVADTDASAKQATELGGSLRVEPFDAPGVGRMAVIADPHGTTFSIIALANPGP
jgi:predicted enzyme related to lactoylglutathione lyase